YFVECMEFADGTVWGPEEVGSRANTIYGTEGNDTLNTVGKVANHDINETFYGGAGDDVIRSGDGNDTIYGEEGNDSVYGGNGDDTLTGGPGDDLLYGAWGNDTYKFNKGDGNDTIYDDGRADDKEDRIAFGEGISPDDVRMRINGWDMVISYGEGDSIRVQDAYRYADGRYFVECMEFADGTVWGPEEINLRVNTVYETEESENSVYMFNVGDGNNTIEYSGYDVEGRIVFGEGISPDSIELNKNSDDFVITYGDEDVITIKKAYQLTDDKCKIDYIEFSDGLVYVIDYENLILQPLTGE
ncbi:MAG: hypothetical protein NC393_02735, partial [Clostridium sp.]|nr:hypothetical protein [Clostridium sp.]MCM1208380.1 hypothetical protein [Ruminococcus sp.]